MNVGFFGGPGVIESVAFDDPKELYAYLRQRRLKCRYFVRIIRSELLNRLVALDTATLGWHGRTLAGQLALAKFGKSHSAVFRLAVPKIHPLIGFFVVKRKVVIAFAVVNIETKNSIRCIAKRKTRSPAAVNVEYLLPDRRPVRPR